MTATGGWCQAEGHVGTGLALHYGHKDRGPHCLPPAPGLVSLCLCLCYQLALPQLDLIYHGKGLFMKKSKHGAAGLGGCGGQYLM